VTDERQHEEIQELLGVHALGATEPFESQVVEKHVTGCDECRRELDGHIRVVDRLPPVQPPASELWSRIESTLEPKRPGRGRQLLVAALVAVVAGFAVQTARVMDLNERVELLEATVANQTVDFATLADVLEGRTFVLVDDDGREMAMVTIADDGRGIVTHSALGPPSANRTYQLWAVLDGEVISAGLLSDDPHGTPFRVDASSLEALVITEEESGGVAVSTQPAVALWSADA
jgi:hypothetical protein